MQSSIVVAAIASCVFVAAVHAQEATPKRSSTETTTPSTVTLTGCVSGKPLSGGDYTFVDNVSGSKYRLTGKGLRKFAGQHVEIVSGKDKKFVIKGGLYPSPNAAAQAGAIDPGQEAIARQPGGANSGTAGTELPEFRVARVRGVPGACQ
jgi:hypothetical protein